MDINNMEISSLIKKKIEELKINTDIYEYGTVIDIGDSIAKVYGLENCKYGELIEFENNEYGIALSLKENYVEIAILENNSKIKEGYIVRRTSKELSVPVSEELIGRIIDPTGKILDEGANIKTENTRPIEYKAPSIIERDPIERPLQTGILAIDAMIPIGRGQRELIIGDKQTGKTTIAIDTIINQKGKDVICIYVAIGGKISDVLSSVKVLEQNEALEYTVIVTATASDSIVKQYIAPYAGCAIAEYFMYEKNKDVLIIYDDLTKHAIAYRALSLLLRKTPGREAYPGDIFYIHSRLLERAGQLNKKLGGGSITAIPIIETQEEDISAYIPTNVISITDGQIHLDTELFHLGQRPAVNSGLSVSRVGSAAQIELMKKVSNSIRINLAQYNELKIFSQFGSELDQTTKAKIEDGEKLLSILKQNKNSPIDVLYQIIMLHCLKNNHLKDIETKEVKKFINSLLEYINSNDEILKEINSLKVDNTNKYLKNLDEIILKYKKESWSNNV